MRIKHMKVQLVMRQQSVKQRNVKREISVFISSLAKGKTNPLQACTVPEGSRRLRLPDFKTIST